MLIEISQTDTLFMILYMSTNHTICKHKLCHYVERNKSNL